MTEQEQRIAIAEACRWKWMPAKNCVHPDQFCWWVPPHRFKLTLILVGLAAVGSSALFSGCERHEPAQQSNQTPIWLGEPVVTNAYTICIGVDAIPSKDNQLVLTWEDGTELRMDLPTNTWLRGWTNR